MSDLLNTGLFVMDFARRATLGFLDGIEGEDLVRAFAEGGSHAAYIAGHIAFTDDMTLKMLAHRDPTLTEAQQKLFDGRVTPSNSQSDYPAKQEILSVMAAVREDLIGYFSGLSNAELTAPVEGPLAQFGDTRAKLMASIAWHEGMHAGQLTVIRRQLGLPRVFG
ncbi:MAG: DinB family protein [Planctomycetota bacterium]